jgi:predicted ATPase
MSTAHPLTNLSVPPRPRTATIGRDSDVAAVSDLLRQDDVHLVTLLGPGGVGKTHLALEVARDAADFPAGIAFVSLAPVRDPTLVLSTIARSLNLSDRGGTPLHIGLATWLRDRRMLLILDNLEQVVTVAPDLSDLLARCPSLTVLATSRVALRVAGERRYQVSPMQLPDLTVSPDSVEMASVDAIALFLQLARAEDPAFTLTEKNASIVAEVCTRLDGLPLALELAAARIRVLSPEALLARLSDRLRLLTDGARDQPARLQTMRDAIAWSYDLLPPMDQVLFRRMAVFVGDSSREAA